jgi:hypothetical protein
MRVTLVTLLLGQVQRQKESYVLTSLKDMKKYNSIDLTPRVQEYWDWDGIFTGEAI